MNNANISWTALITYSEKITIHLNLQYYTFSFDDNIHFSTGRQ